MTPEQILEHLDRHVPDFAPDGLPELLSGGYLNHVWRVPGQYRSGPWKSLIVKFAPPHIASQPDVPLDPHRAAIEAQCMTALNPGGELSHIGGEAIRPPRLVDFDAQARILVMEDVGDCPDLGAWLWHESCLEETGHALGKQIGTFIGALHKRTHSDPHFAQVFGNPGIQRTRLEVQYKAIGDLCEKANLPGARELGSKALALGELLQEPGLCLIMGDLWPPSIRVTTEGIRLIDWELAHYGRPSQDVGHLAAHLWMYAHRAPPGEAAARVWETLHDFLSAYRATLGEQFDEVFGAPGLRESAIHMGAEILVRAIGRFKEGYLYGGLSPDDPQVREAVEAAAQHIRSSDNADTFGPLK
jgi:5-methylthioribose kinase